MVWLREMETEHAPNSVSPSPIHQEATVAILLLGLLRDERCSLL